MNKLLSSNKIDFNSSNNNLSQQIQLFNQERTEQNEDEIMESKFEKIKPSEADDIIKEYEEEVKDQINSSDFDYTDQRLMMKKQD